MKKLNLIFLIIASMLPGTNLWSQSDTAKNLSKHKSVFEAGTNLYNLTIRPGNFYTSYNRVIDNQVFSGLYLKYHKGLNALRWELNYSQRNLRYGNGYRGFAKNLNVTKSVEIKMGYQRSFGKRRFSIYGFADLEYNHFWAPNNNYFYPYYYDMLIAPNYYGGSFVLSGSFFCVTPGIGLKWKMGKHLVLNIESAAQFFYSRERPDYYTTDKPIESIGINLKPLKFSLGFSF